MQKLGKGANFKQLAAAESAGDKALQGGDLGWRHLAEIPTIFADSVKTMHSGQLAGPLRAPNGFHIIKLVAIRGGKQDLTKDEVRNLIYQRKYEEKVQIWLQQLRAQAYIKYLA